MCYDISPMLLTIAQVITKDPIKQKKGPACKAERIIQDTGKIIRGIRASMIRFLTICFRKRPFLLETLNHFHIFVSQDSEIV